MGSHSVLSSSRTAAPMGPGWSVLGRLCSDSSISIESNLAALRAFVNVYQFRLPPAVRACVGSRGL